MSIRSVLNEELERLLAAEKSYNREIKVAPKGSIQMKKINGKTYPYLVFRNSGKVVSKYLGSLSPSELDALKKQIALRSKQQQNLREVRSNRAFLEKVVNGRKQPK